MSVKIKLSITGESTTQHPSSWVQAEQEHYLYTGLCGNPASNHKQELIISNGRTQKPPPPPKKKVNVVLLIQPSSAAAE